MFIDDMRIRVVEQRYDGSLSNPRMVWRRKQAVLIELTDGAGVSGWGECWTFDRSADALVRFLQTEVRPRVAGRAHDGIGALWRDIWSDTVLSGRHGMTAAALAGVDCACWDILARHRGASVACVLAPGGASRPVPVYASGGLYRRGESAEQLADAMAGYVGQGFGAVKMKIGGRSLAEDLDRVVKVREAVGPDTALILDAVYSLDAARARRWLPHWRRLGVAAIQAPFPPDDWDSMRWLNIDCGIPVMAFEAECRIGVFRALLDREALGIVQFSPIAAGGVTGALGLIDLAGEYGRPVSLQCSSTGLAQRIALNIAAARPSVAHVEIHQVHRMLSGHVRLPGISDGRMALRSGVGFGFDPPEGLGRDCTEGLPDLTLISDKANIS